MTPAVVGVLAGYAVLVVVVAMGTRTEPSVEALELHLEVPIVPLPAGEVGGESGLDLLGLSACPLQEKAIEVNYSFFLSNMRLYHECNIWP